jgi:hypothetical protein
MTRECPNPHEASTPATGKRFDKPRSAPLYPGMLTVAALVLGAAATRLIPHWWNLTAVGAVCLFGGAYFQRKWVAFVVPLAALAISDVLLQTFIYPQYGPSYFKYGCFALIVPLGFLLRGRTKLLPVASSAVAATALFFLLSNFQVWMSGHGRLYPYTAAGLMACYVAALPFSLNMLYGNLLFSGLLFGGMEYFRVRRPALARSASAMPAA